MLLSSQDRKIRPIIAIDMKYSNKKTICVAMSGGVDSSVAAALLQKQGYQVIGLFMRFWSDPKALKSNPQNRCCSLESYEDAKKVAQQLGFKLYTLNLKQPFKKYVVDYFLKSFQQGLTPNPCIQCNQFIKFDLFLKKAKALGANYIATGHYAQVKKQGSSYQLLKAKDLVKDQSYFLYRLKQKQLKQILFPIGDYTKPRVRELARKFGLKTHSKSDSQEICFIPEKNHNDFLKRYLKLKPGPISDQKNQEICQHEGLPLYTIGQRKGIGIGGGTPYYVVSKDAKKNVLYVTTNPQDQGLFSKELTVQDLIWISGNKPSKDLNITAKIRSTHQAQPAKLVIQGRKVRVVFTKPQRAIAPGQSVVFYQRDKVLGGGIILGK